MAGSFTTVDLSELPAPTIIETLDFETIFSEMLADLVSRDPEFSALLESDPAYKLLETASYREIVIRQLLNDKCKGMLLAYATGTNLDCLAALYNLLRLEISPGDPDAVPPVPPTYESDADFRARVQLAPEAMTTAGSEGSYVFHALSADPDVKDVQAVSPDPGEVVVYVLSRSGDGTASTDLLAKVAAALSPASVRPLTDFVTTESVTPVEFSVGAELTLYPGPDAAVVLASAQAAVEAEIEKSARIGYDMTRARLIRALAQPGVQNVALASPGDDVVVGDGEVAACVGITITVAEATSV